MWEGEGYRHHLAWTKRLPKLNKLLKKYPPHTYYLYSVCTIIRACLYIFFCIFVPQWHKGKGEREKVILKAGVTTSTVKVKGNRMSWTEPVFSLVHDYLFKLPAPLPLRYTCIMCLCNNNENTTEGLCMNGFRARKFFLQREYTNASPTGKEGHFLLPKYLCMILNSNRTAYK